MVNGGRHDTHACGSLVMMIPLLFRVFEESEEEADPLAVEIR
jgi:hypothetical protein